MTFSIREGGPPDYDAVSALWRRADAHRRGTDVDDPVLLSDSFIRSRLRVGWFFVAVVAERILGCARASPAREDAGNGAPIPGLVHVSLVAVDPAAWGKGIGSALVERVLHSARERNFTVAQLWVHVGNDRAAHIYERFGFRATGEIRDDDHGFTMALYRLEALG